MEALPAPALLALATLVPASALHALRYVGVGSLSAHAILTQDSKPLSTMTHKDGGERGLHLIVFRYAFSTHPS